MIWIISCYSLMFLLHKARGNINKRSGQLISQSALSGPCLYAAQAAVS